MLAAIIANLQNQPQPTKLPTVKIDRGGGGQSWPGYDIVDIITAINAFQEIPGEHPVVRAIRRTKWIGQALPGVKEAREKREAVVFLTGAALAEAAAEERHAVMDQLKIDQLVEIIDAVRAEARPLTLPDIGRAITLPERGASDGMGGGLAIGLLVGGLLVGAALARCRTHTR